MKILCRLLSIVCILAVWIPNAGAQRGGVHPPPGGYRGRRSDFDTVSKVEQEFEDGFMNGWFVTLQRVISDDCSFVSDKGMVSDKAEVLHTVAAHEIRVASWRFTDTRVRLYKKTAIVSGLLNKSPLADGEKSAQRFRFLRAVFCPGIELDPSILGVSMRSAYMWARCIEPSFP